MLNQKNRMSGLTHALILAITANAGIALAQGGPRYASPEAKSLILKMVAAHGGIARWKSAPSLSYQHEMIDPSHPDDPWRSVEVIEQGSRRLYQDWPLDGGKLAFDGSDVWTENWGRGNPPGMMAFVSYFFLNLPFITQDDGVMIGTPNSGMIPEGTAPPDGKTYDIVRMRYDPASTGASPDEYFDLYIDPESHLLAAVQYTVTYRPLMDMFGVPKEVKFMGPLFKRYDEYVDVDGLKLPARYNTYRNGVAYGIHTATDYSLTKEFDASRLTKTPGAVVDESFSKFKYTSN